MKDFEFEHELTSYSAKNAYWMGQASKLAYANPAKISEVVQSWGLDQFEFVDGTRTNTQAFIAANRDVIFVAFRGTEGKLRDWLTDSKIKQVDNVHRGFKKAVDEVLPVIEVAIHRFIGERLTVAEAAESPENPQVPSIWYTGHSLGAALATLTVAYMRQQGLPVDGLYTFGQPRTGNRGWSKSFNSDCEGLAYRHVNNNDLVTRVPPRSLNYRHIGALRYYDARQNCHEDLSFWHRFLDRVKGRLDDFMDLHTDGIKDHGMDKYLACLEKNYSK